MKHFLSCKCATYLPTWLIRIKCGKIMLKYTVIWSNIRQLSIRSCHVWEILKCKNNFDLLCKHSVYRLSLESAVSRFNLYNYIVSFDNKISCFKIFLRLTFKSAVNFCWKYLKRAVNLSNLMTCVRFAPSIRFIDLLLFLLVWQYRSGFYWTLWTNYYWLL